MSALYRMYRPQFFREVIGQEQVKHPLQEALKSGRIVHSYLFAGPRGTGKTTMARIFAKALNCENRDPENAEPCGTCESCLGIAAGNFVDLIEIDAASNRGIDEIRNLKELVRFAPSKKGRFKVFIIDEAHMLTAAASNAFLKTLEEPPSHVIFIFATTDPHKMLSTILSRVQRFSFHSLTNEKLRSKLQRILSEEQVEIDPEVIELLILQAMGGMRDAESILGKLLSLNISPITKEDAYRVLGKYPYFEVYEFIEKLGQGDVHQMIPYVQSLTLEYHPEQFLTMMMSQARKLMLYSFSPSSLESLDLLEAETEQIERISSKLSGQALIRLMKLVEEALERASNSFIPSLPLEMLCVEFILPVPEVPENSTPNMGIGSTPHPTDPLPSAQPTPTATNIIQPTPATSQTPIDPFENVDSSTHESIVTPAPSSPLPSTGGMIDVETYMPILKGKIASKVRAILPMFENSRFEVSGEHIAIVGGSRIAENRLKKHSAFLTDTFRTVIGQNITLSFTHEGSTSPAPAVQSTPTPPAPSPRQQTPPPAPDNSETDSVSPSQPETSSQSEPPSNTDEVEDIFKEFL
jgi:DNA polymerase-3 subunit gamma/tau